MHNRIDSIWHRAAMIQELFPGVRIGVGHGQMAEAELEKVMLQFMRHEFDVFVSTTIVENGLDIPLANTMIIENAEKYGLRSCISCAGAWGARTGALTAICSSSRTPSSPKWPASGWLR